ncbi:hypothetical protein ACVWXU_006166 [Streptomyces sp. TE33382]
MVVRPSPYRRAPRRHLHPPGLRRRPAQGARRGGPGLQGARPDRHQHDADRLVLPRHGGRPRLLLGRVRAAAAPQGLVGRGGLRSGRGEPRRGRAPRRPHAHRGLRGPRPGRRLRPVGQDRQLHRRHGEGHRRGLPPGHRPRRHPEPPPRPDPAPARHGADRPGEHPARRRPHGPGRADRCRLPGRRGLAGEVRQPRRTPVHAGLVRHRTPHHARRRLPEPGHRDPGPGDRQAGPHTAAVRTGQPAPGGRPRDGRQEEQVRTGQAHHGPQEDRPDGPLRDPGADHRRRVRPGPR